MPEVFSRAAVARQLDNCTYCPKMCRFACPVSEASGHEPYTPQAKMDRLNQLRLGRVPWTEETTDPLYACTGCRQCTTQCLHGNEPGLVLLAGRATASARGAGHPALRGYPERFRNREQRLVDTLLAELAPSWFADSADIGFFPGCDAVDKGMEDVHAALGLFERVGAAGVRVVAGGQSCGGYPLVAAGLTDMFRWHATRVAAALKPYRTVVVNCSACLYTMRALYRAEGVALSSEVLSLAELLDRLAGAIPERPRAGRRTVYYHDPCYLARYSNVQDEPRRVLARVADVIELSGSREETECCGGAGLLPKTMPEVADQMARRRLREVAARGGGTVVTSCATCAFMLRRNAPSGVTVHDLPRLIAEETGEAGPTEAPPG
ncbi:MAG TPA: (Fe-S)-binding protein [Kofleriaceae bacterium]|nr:(Fe-S)-binding protein [Kofleriaceae bacterium]